MTGHPLRWWLGLVLLLASSAALALGLGEIRVKSQPGQPLVAEIPVISSEPGELEQLQARLASPVTFERVGLPRPQGLVNNLNFSVALDDAGRPVIRVTTIEPVDVAVVNFLIEVDWGQGRLVREYSALISAPGTLAASAQPYIEAPAAAPSDVIARPPVAPVAVAPAPEASAEPAAEATPANDSAIVPAPVAAPPPRRSPAPAVTASLEEGQTTVRRGQNLSQIAQQLSAGSPYSLDQTMIALLRANPDAFIRGNINLLKQGAVLRVPASNELAQVQEAEAAALVRDQIAEWRQARRPIPQPVANNNTAVASVPGAGNRVADARLEIAPPVAANATQAGTQSGISAGGEGDMLANEQLQQTREDLAARESEVQELRVQVAELEKLKQQQSQLIAMKDSDLAAAQQKLAGAHGSTGVPIWAWAGLALILIGVFAWGWSNRRQRVATAKPARNSGYDSAALAAAMPATESAASDRPASVVTGTDAKPVSTPVLQHKVSVATPTVAPAWHSGSPVASTLGGLAPLNPAPAGRDRLELAIAYLDLGDVVTARDLLNEVIAGGDPSARGEAEQLLREIG